MRERWTGCMPPEGRRYADGKPRSRFLGDFTRLIGKVRLMPTFILTLGLFRTKGNKHEKNLSAVPEPR